MRRDHRFEIKYTSTLSVEMIGDHLRAYARAKCSILAHIGEIIGLPDCATDLIGLHRTQLGSTRRTDLIAASPLT
jgi:hypothetical protein